MTKTIPSPDPFDTTIYPCGKEAGANKFGTTSCPTCGKPPTHPTAEEYPDVNAQISASGYFMFRDELSAKEYYISGMCQACQDSVFGGSDDEIAAIQAMIDAIIDGRVQIIAKVP